MPNLREITTNLDGSKFKEDDEWPETSILIAHLNFYVTKVFNLDEQLRSKAFYELLAGASQAQTKLDKTTIHSIWRGILRDEVNTDDADEGRIFNFLPSAPKLKKLSVGLDWENLQDFVFVVRTHVVPLAKIFGDNFVWAHYFNHDYGSIHAEELKPFWARHSTTLKIFGLYRPHLETGTWRDVFGFIKEQPGLCLENIVIHEPSENSESGRSRIYSHRYYSKKINEYVLRGGPPFPPTEAESKE
ncbi:hypothetical protein RUND412_007804 [Rhizina undulata]